MVPSGLNGRGRTGRVSREGRCARLMVFTRVTDRGGIDGFLNDIRDNRDI